MTVLRGLPGGRRPDALVPGRPVTLRVDHPSLQPAPEPAPAPELVVTALSLLVAEGRKSRLHAVREAADMVAVHWLSVPAPKGGA